MKKIHLILPLFAIIISSCSKDVNYSDSILGGTIWEKHELTSGEMICGSFEEGFKAMTQFTKNIITGYPFLEHNTSEEFDTTKKELTGHTTKTKFSSIEFHDTDGYYYSSEKGTRLITQYQLKCNTITFLKKEYHETVYNPIINQSEQIHIIIKPDGIYRIKETNEICILRLDDSTITIGKILQKDNYEEDFSEEEKSQFSFKRIGNTIDFNFSDGRIWIGDLNLGEWTMNVSQTYPEKIEIGEFGM